MGTLRNLASSSAAGSGTGFLFPMFSSFFGARLRAALLLLHSVQQEALLRVRVFRGSGSGCDGDPAASAGEVCSVHIVSGRWGRCGEGESQLAFE